MYFKHAYHDSPLLTITILLGSNLHLIISVIFLFRLCLFPFKFFYSSVPLGLGYFFKAANCWDIMVK